MKQPMGNVFGPLFSNPYGENENKLFINWKKLENKE